jgi:hypothetical protein
LKAPVLKTGRDESPSWVRIPPPPHPSLQSREKSDWKQKTHGQWRFSDPKATGEAERRWGCKPIREIFSNSILAVDFGFPAG